LSNLISLQYIHPPALPENIISRDKLVKLIIDNRSKPLILLNAAAGYGKTILLSACNKAGPQNFAWLTAPANILNPAQFIKYAVKAIQVKRNTFGENVLPFIENFTGRWNKNNIIELVTIFLNEAASSLNSPLTLIIDDFQNLETENNNWIDTLFTELFSALPDRLRLIISTRQLPLFKISRLEAKRMLFTMTTEDLRMDPEDTVRLTREIYKIDDTEICKKLLEQTEGWVTSMHLLLQSGEYLKNRDIVFTKNLYSYIAEDIFSSIELNLRHFLLKTAWLDVFNEEFTDKLFGITNSGEIIQKLISKNIFLEHSFSGNADCYYYQKLFSDFLRKYSYEMMSSEEIAANFSEIANIYLSESRDEEALWFLVKTGNITKFKEIISAGIENKFEKSDFYTIEGWLNFALKLEITEPLYRYYRLKYLIRTNNLEQIFLEEFEKLCVGSDTGFRLTVHLLKAEYFILTSKPESALNVLESLSGKIKDVNLKKQYFLLLCQAYYRSGFKYFDTLTQLAEEAIEFYDENNITGEKLQVIGYLANISSGKWENNSAIRYHESILKIEKDFQKIFINFSNLIDLYSDSGLYEKAYGLINEAENVYRRYPTPYFQRLLLRAKSKFYNNLGDYNFSLEIWRQLESNSSIIKNRFLSWSYYVHYCETFYFLNENKQGAEYFYLGKKYSDNDEYSAIMNKFLEHYYCASDITSVETEEAVKEMLEFHRSNDLLMIIPQMEYHLSKIHLEQTLYTSSEEYLSSSLKKYTEKKQTSFLETELLLSRKPFDFAVSRNIEKGLINSVFDAIESKLSLRFINSNYRDELTSRVFRLKDITFRPFGNTEFYLRGEPVPEDKWIRKKSKILLAYLMSDPEKIHTKDKIMDMFFGDAPPDKADMVYHSAVYNIRTALKIYDIKVDKPKRSKDKTYDYNPQYILYEDKTLRLNPDFYYNAVNIEFEKLFGKSKLPSISKEEKITYSIKAVEMYKGDFMPGYYDGWCEELRVKYKNMFINLNEELIQLLETNARYDEAVKYSELLLKEDRLNDSAHLSIINSYSKLGNINMAKNRYELMLKIYDEELGEQPTAKTLKLIKSILED
jgi:DNA-binding SARP family transcriptional activator